MGTQAAPQRSRTQDPQEDRRGLGRFDFREAPGMFINVRGYKNDKICFAFTFFK